MLRYSLSPRLVVCMVFFALGSGATSAVTEAEWNSLAEKGGAHLGAIVFAQEFKKTSCGSLLNIGEK